MKSNKVIFIKRTCLVFVVTIFMSGCATHRSIPKPIVLSSMPVYNNTRTNWNTSANCMVYPMPGKEMPANAGGVSESVKTILQENGYKVVEMDTHMSIDKRDSVDKIIIPVSHSSRNRVIKGTNIWDTVTIYSIQNTSELSLNPDEKVNSRYFQVWARNEEYMPYRQSSENLMKIDAFRAALEK